eukprot:6881383-Pyramimonas_sp.AAC.1
MRVRPQGTNVVLGSAWTCRPVGEEAELRGARSLGSSGAGPAAGAERDLSGRPKWARKEWAQCPTTN